MCQPKVLIIESRVVHYGTPFIHVNHSRNSISQSCLLSFSHHIQGINPRFPIASLSNSLLINVRPLLLRTTNHLPKRLNLLISKPTEFEILAWYHSLSLNPLPAVLLALNASPQQHASQLSSITISSYLRTLLM
jgi:hypothetical protein